MTATSATSSRLRGAGLALAAAALLTFAAGVVGFHLGFARLLSLDHLQRGMTNAAADGIAMLLQSPRRLFDAGLADTGRWMLGMLAAVIGAVLLTLTAIEPGGEEERRGGAARLAGAILGLAACVGSAAVAIVLARQAVQTPLADVPSDRLGAFTAELGVLAGLLVVVLLGSLLWCAFLLKASVPLIWLAFLCRAGGGLSAAIVAMCTAIAVGAASHMEIDRPLVFAPASAVNPGPGLLIGYTAGHTLLLGGQGQVFYLPLQEPLTPVGSHSITGFLQYPPQSPGRSEDN